MAVFPVLLLVLVVSTGSPAHAQTQTPCAIYVNASDGADSNPGSLTQPLRSLERALGRLSDNEAACVAAGEYFLGDDADGVAITGGARDITMVLNAFAGDETVRISGEELLLDLPGGSLTVVAGTGSELVFGRGVLNGGGGGAPGAMESLIFRSGTLTIAPNVTFLVEDVVGSTSRPGARIELGDGHIIGIPVFAPSARRILLTNSNQREHPIVPDPGIGGQLIHRSGAPTTIGSRLDLQGATFISESSELLTFAGQVAFAPASSTFGGAMPGAHLEFASRLELTGPASGLSLSGAELIIDELTIPGPGNWPLSLSAESGRLARISPGPDATLNLALSGSFDLGNQSTPAALAWRGSLHVLSDTLTTWGNISVSGATPFIIDTSTVLQIGAGVLTTSTGGARIAVHGTVTATSGAPAFDLDQDGHLELTGELSGIRVTGATLDVIGTGRFTSHIDLDDGARMIVNGVINGAPVLDMTNSELELPPDSRLHTASAQAVGSIIGMSEESELHISGSAFFDATSQFTDPSGAIVLGTGADTFEEHVTNVLPLLVSRAQNVDIRVSGTLQGLSLEQGTARIVTGGESIQLSTLSATESTFSVRTGGQTIRLTNGLEIVDSGAEFRDAGRLEISGVLRIQSSQVTWPENGLAAGIDRLLDIQGPDPIVLPDLILDREEVVVLIGTDVTLNKSLEMLAGKLIVNSGSTITLLSSLSRTNGRFEPVAGGRIRFEGHPGVDPGGEIGIRTISGFTTSVLPSIEVDGVQVALDEDGTILGDLVLQSGGFVLGESRALSVSRNVQLHGGVADLLQGSRLFASNDLSLQTVSLSLSGANLRVGRNLLVGTTATILGTANELTAGGSGPAVVSLEQPFTVLDFNVGGTSPVQVTGDSVLVHRTFRIANGATLELLSSVRHVGLDAAPTAVNHGSMTGTGSLIFSGPASHTMQGIGSWGRLEIALNDPDALVVADPGSEPVHLSGGVTFTRGGLDVANRPVLLASSEDATLPEVTLTLTSSPGHGGIRDGRGFSSASGTVQILPESRYELAYTGEVVSLSEPGNEFIPGLVQGLDVDIRDAVNSPPVFGLRVTRSLDLSGTLHIGNESLVRLDGADIELTGPGVRHTLEGRLTGPGRLFITVPGTQLLGSGGSPSRLARLFIDVPVGSAEVLISDLTAADVLSLTRGNVALLSATPIEIRALEMTGGRLRVAQPVVIGSAGRLNVQAGQVQLDTGSGVSAQDGVPITILDPVEWSVSSTRDEDGYLVLAGSHSFRIGTALPRLRLDSTPGGLRTIDVTSDLFITDHLDQRAGQLSLASNRLTLSGARWTVGPQFGTQPAIVGDPSTQLAEVHFSSSVALELHQDLRLFAAELISEASSLVLTTLPADQPPYNLVVDGGRATLLNGSVNLGRSDLVITSSQSEALSLGPGLTAVSGSGNGAGQPGAGTLFNDDFYSEIVLFGSGSTSIAAAGDVQIPALRIRGTARVLTSDGTLTITNRLVFGERGATLLTDRSGQITLADGALVLRRGKGTLTHRPSMNGDIDLAYDMDDGSWTGRDSGFEDAVLTAGTELPDRVRSLTVLAGNRGPTVHTLTLGAPITVTEHLRVLSGTLSAPTASAPLTLATGSTLTLGGVDEAAAAGWTPGAHTIFNGSLNLDVSSFSSIDITSSMLPESVPLDSARFALLSPLASVRLARDIEATSVLLQGVDASSRLRLAGHQLLATQAFSARNITISSSQIARLTSHGTLDIEGGAVQENVLLRADGDLVLSSDVSNLEIVAGGNLEVDEERFAPQQLTLTGPGKDWFLQGDVTVGRVRLDLPDGGVFTLGGPGAALRVTGTLELVSGVLTSRNVVTELVAPLPGFERVAGHVDGPIRREVQAGDTETVLFPTGDRTTYMPISLTPGSGYISDASFTAEARMTQAHERNGLPVAGPDGRILVDAARSVWSLTSTVNFAQSQPVTVSVSLPESPSDDADAHQLMRRERLHAAPWVAIPGTPVSTGTTSGLLVRHIDAVGMLTPSGFEIGVGTGSLLSTQSAESQVVNLTGESLTIHTDRNPFVLASGNASAMWTGGLSPGVQRLDWSVSSPQGHEVNLESIADAGRTGLAVLLPPDVPGSIPQLIIPSWTTPSATSLIDLAFVHAWPGGPTVELRLSDTPANLLGDLSAGERAGPVPLDQDTFVLTAAYGPPENRTEQFVLDLATSGRPTSVLLLRDTALIVLRDGSVRNLAVVTGVEAPRPGTELPTALRIHPIYPNPVRGAGTIPVDVPAAAAVRVTLVDMLGREVRRFDGGRLAPGLGQPIRVDASGLAAGTYLYVVEAAAAGQTWRETGTMTVLR